MEGTVTRVLRPRRALVAEGVVMARPSKRTAALLEAILTDLRPGAPLRAAAAANGISEDTLQRWRSDPGLALRIDQAQAEALRACEQTIHRAATEGNWKAALAYASRRSPDEWGDPHRALRLEAGPNAGPLRIVLDLGEPTGADDTVAAEGTL